MLREFPSVAVVKTCYRVVVVVMVMVMGLMICILMTLDPVLLVKLLCPTECQIFVCLDSYCLTNYCPSRIWYTIASKKRTPKLSSFLKNNC